ncbi:hypothetical protein AVEN_249398-1 [Araneus ventricosus]|uniref:Uncharacterized protein n=1 Tax=Araneus ventricosus TaxID=182803 RepID=A0A4Y2IAM1_ARAVE|nr:hypothetical protein AVEN_249398-1 [Araneus ventricosus]
MASYGDRDDPNNLFFIAPADNHPKSNNPFHFLYLQETANWWRIFFHLLLWAPGGSEAAINQSAECQPIMRARTSRKKKEEIILNAQFKVNGAFLRFGMRGIE